LKKFFLIIWITGGHAFFSLAQGTAEYPGRILQSVVIWLVISGILLVVLLFMARQLYLLAQSRQKALEIIREQKAALEQAQEKLRTLNEDQERIIEERTRDVIKQSEKILEYAFMNAHSLRGPLARVLGLVHLIKGAEEQKEIKDMVDRLDVSAQELDQVVRDINKRLNDEYGDPEEEKINME
jgi:signal transduction histidine kinase